MFGLYISDKGEELCIPVSQLIKLKQRTTRDRRQGPHTLQIIQSDSSYICE